MKRPHIAAAAAISAAVALALGSAAQAQGSKKAGGKHDMTFFVTSVGKGDGANLGGLEGADAYCNTLAKAVGSKHANWHAYLSTALPRGEPGVSARDRIGKGPWYNAKGVMIAKSVANLHSDKNNLTKQTALTEKGEMVKGRGDKPNEHDALTGSDPEGRFSTAGGDTTCGNWTKDGDDGSAIVGHIDRQGLTDAWHSKLWNSSHGTAGCSQAKLVSTGGAGLFYCFVPN